MKAFEPEYKLMTAFDDFLTMALCACSQNPNTGLSYDEDLYLATVAKYATNPLRHHFPKLFAQLTLEMEARMAEGSSFDILGEFYEEYLARKRLAQTFTPWALAQLVAMTQRIVVSPGDEPLHIADFGCGSGRLLLAASREFGSQHFYYGIDADETCVKMTALNMLLSGIFKGEVMCADALNLDDFRFSYRTSFMPFGVFRITDKHRSPLWHRQQNSFERKPRDPDSGSQLSFF